MKQMRYILFLGIFLSLNGCAGRNIRMSNNIAENAILSADSPTVFAYTTTTGGMRRGASMHLAIEQDGIITPLNFGLGVLYANSLPNAASVDPNWSISRRVMINPWIFRMSDGRIGVVAQNADGYAPYEQTDIGMLSFWTTDDLVNYDWHGLVTVAPNEHIVSPQVFYNPATESYVITWLNGNQVREASTTAWDMPSSDVTFTPPVNATSFSIAVASVRDRKNHVKDISYGTVTSIFELTAAEAQYLTRRLGKVRNTHIDTIAPIIVAVGTELTLPTTLRAHYTDTSTSDIPIIWDETSVAAVNTNVPGSFTVTGTAAVSDFPFPFIESRADPSAILFEGMYYFIATRDEGGEIPFQTVYSIRGSNSLMGLATAPESHLYFTTDFNRDNTGNVASRPSFFPAEPYVPVSGNFWAPELQVIDGQLRILSAISPTNMWNNVQSIIMTLREGGDPLNPDDWSKPEWILRADGSPLTSLPDGTNRGISLDMTYFYENGVHYYIWSARWTGVNISVIGSDANLSIATFCPTDPTRLTSDPVILTRPMPSWANVDDNSPVDEGPFILRSPEGRIFMAISGSGTTETYAIALMEATPGTAENYGIPHLLDPANWRRGNFPVLATVHTGQPGPGHNTFVKDEFGRDVIVFHSGIAGINRHTGFRTVHWGYGGYPILYMTADEILKPQYRNVEVIVVVE